MKLRHKIKWKQFTEALFNRTFQKQCAHKIYLMWNKAANAYENPAVVHDANEIRP